MFIPFMHLKVLHPSAFSDSLADREMKQKKKCEKDAVLGLRKDVLHPKTLAISFFSQNKNTLKCIHMVNKLKHNKY